MLSYQLMDDLELRLATERDADAIHALVDANRDHLSPWMPWAADQQIEKTRAFVKRARTAYADETGMDLFVFRGDQPLGSCGFNGVDMIGRSAGIGYWLAADEQGKGIITTGVRALCAHAFGPMRLRRVELMADVDNGPSRAVAERCGFQLEGIKRDGDQVNGRWISLAVYSRLAVDGD